MNTKENQRSRLTKLLLKQAFLHLMHGKAPTKISVKEICAEAGLNRSTFYLHYNEPNDLLMELEEDAMDLVSGSLSSIASLNSAASDALELLRSFLHGIREHDELFRALLVENTDPHFRRKLLASALTLTETSFDIDLDPSIKSDVYLFLVSGSIELLTDWIKNSYPIPEPEMCRLLFALCEAGLRTASKGIGR